MFYVLLTYCHSTNRGWYIDFCDDHRILDTKVPSQQDVVAFGLATLNKICQNIEKFIYKIYKNKTYNYLWEACILDLPHLIELVKIKKSSFIRFIRIRQITIVILITYYEIATADLWNAAFWWKMMEFWLAKKLGSINIKREHFEQWFDW